MRNKNHLSFLTATFTAIAFTAISFAAEITGTWHAEFDTRVGRQKYTFRLKNEDGKPTGRATAEARGETREVELKDIKIDGDKVSFTEMLKMGANEIPITYTGTVAGGELRLTREVGNIAKESIVATRDEKPAAARPGRTTTRSAVAGGLAVRLSSARTTSRHFPRRRRDSTNAARTSRAAGWR